VTGDCFCAFLFFLDVFPEVFALKDQCCSSAVLKTATKARAWELGGEAEGDAAGMSSSINSIGKRLREIKQYKVNNIGHDGLMTQYVLQQDGVLCFY
jgi:hypothetical protein